MALKLRQNHGNIYLHAQIFAGSMYVAASICMWVLRAWKIVEIEQIAAEQGKVPEEVDVVSVEPATAALSASSRSKLVEVSVVRRLFQWKRV